MNAKGKKFVSLFLVFSLLALSGNLIAKERRGAELIIQKTDGQQVGGELIAVKQNSLLLKDSESGADVSVDIKDISEIIIVKKSKAGLGLGIGLLIGGGCSALIGYTAGWEIIGGDGSSEAYATFFGVIGGTIGAIIGGIVGAAAGKDEIIQIDGKSDSEIKTVLRELRKKARIPDYQ